MKKICVSTVSWFLSTDFQLHSFSIIPLYISYKSRKFGISFIIFIIIASSVGIAGTTYLYDLLPFVQMSCGDKQKIQDTIDYVHLRPYTHAAPYYIGILLGIIILDYKNIRLSVAQNFMGWICSILLALTALYGGHNWNVGNPESPLVTALFAAMHRTTFALAVAWVAFICITKNGGAVNKLLSSPMLAPAGKLTYMIFMLHSLIFWVRKASVRERKCVSHYNLERVLMYEYIGNIAFTVMICIPCHLLLEAPINKLDALFFTEKKKENGNERKEERKEDLQANVLYRSNPRIDAPSKDVVAESSSGGTQNIFINYPNKDGDGVASQKTVIHIKSSFKKR